MGWSAVHGTQYTYTSNESCLIAPHTTHYTLHTTHNVNTAHTEHCTPRTAYCTHCTHCTPHTVQLCVSLGAGYYFVISCHLSSPRPTFCHQHLSANLHSFPRAPRALSTGSYILTILRLSVITWSSTQFGLAGWEKKVGAWAQCLRHTPQWIESQNVSSIIYFLIWIWQLQSPGREKQM